MIGRGPPSGRYRRVIRGRPTAGRGQANLIALAAALLVVTTAATLGLALADAALSGTEREPIVRGAADSTADRLVAADAPTTYRENVLNESALGELDVDELEQLAPPTEQRDVRVRVDDTTILERGSPDTGVTVRRVVLVGTETTATRTASLEQETTTLPRRTGRVRLSFDPEPETTVVTVRTNDRVALHDPDGVDGPATVPVSRYQTTTLSFETAGSGGGVVEISYYPLQANKAVLEVSIDA